MTKALEGLPFVIWLEMLAAGGLVVVALRVALIVWAIYSHTPKMPYVAENPDHSVPIIVPWIAILAGWTVGFRQLALAYKLVLDPTMPSYIWMDAYDDALLHLLKSVIGEPVAFYAGAACIGILGLLCTFGPLYMKYSWSKTHLVSLERNLTLRRRFKWLYPAVVSGCLSVISDVCGLTTLSTVFTVIFWIAAAYWLFLA
jgi:hypothetical protein